MTVPNTQSSGTVTSEAAESNRGEVLADIHCRTCLRALRGETIRRHDPNGLLVVNCPACGAANAANAFPVASGVGATLRFLGAALWLLTLVVLLFSTFMPVAPTSYQIGRDGTGRVRELIQIRYEAYLQEQHGQDAANASRFLYGYDDRFAAWWSQQDGSAFIAELGGWWSAVDWKQIIIHWWPIPPTYFGLGIVWAGLLWSRPVGYRMLVAVACGAVTWAMAQSVALLEFVPVGGASVHNVANGFVVPGVLAISVAVITAAFIAGVALGGPIVRGLVRALLPRRERSALGALGRPRKELTSFG